MESRPCQRPCVRRARIHRPLEQRLVGGNLVLLPRQLAALPHVPDVPTVVCRRGYLSNPNRRPHAPNPHRLATASRHSYPCRQGGIIRALAETLGEASPCGASAPWRPSIARRPLAYAAQSTVVLGMDVRGSQSQGRAVILPTRNGRRRRR